MNIFAKGNELILGKRIKKVILLILVLVFFVGLFEYLNESFNFGIPCPLNSIFGIACPFCGMTRAFFSLLRLDFYQAIRYNAFSVIFFPGILLYFLSEAFSFITNREHIYNKKVFLCLCVGFAVCIIVYGVIRNISCFSYLLPTELI